MDEVAIYENDLPAILDDNLVAVAMAAERRIAAVNKIKGIVLAVTSKNDWIDQQGKPYLVVSGAEKVASVFGISWRIDEPQVEMLEDGHYNISYKGYFNLGARSIEVVGTRSSRDPNYSKKGDTAISPQEIDKNDVKKAALTNCIGNGITRLLGIRNLSWDEVARDTGIKQEDVGKVEYKETAAKISKLRKDIGDMILEMCGGDKDKAGNKLEEITKWESKDGTEHAGKRSCSDLTDKQVPVIYGKVKDIFGTWLDEQAAS